MTFNDLNLSKFLLNALDDLGFTEPTPIQEKVFSVVMSGKDVCAIAQTGTGKTYAYLLPALRQYQFSKEGTPQLLIIVPTRELVVQVVESVEKMTKYMTARTVGVYGGVNTRPQAAAIMQGVDILVATPGRLVDFLNSGILKPKNIKRLILDEFDEMLNLGFRAQLSVIFDKLPEKRQNLLFSATLTPEVEELVDSFFNAPVRIETERVGTPLDGIAQSHYVVPNFYTKLNLLDFLLETDKTMTKVLVFVSTKKLADRVYEHLKPIHGTEIDIIHGNKHQNHRFNSVNQFEDGFCRILIATDIIARGLDVNEVTHVLNFDLPDVPENYIHRIGRTGRFDKTGVAISFIKDTETEMQNDIERLMATKIPFNEFPETVAISEELLDGETEKVAMKFLTKPPKIDPSESAFQEKLEKNKKVNVRYDHEAAMKLKYGKAYERRKKK
jgi:ATP-dependent RNA helicase RhlE